MILVKIQKAKSYLYPFSFLCYLHAKKTTALLVIQSFYLETMIILKIDKWMGVQMNHH